MFDWFWEFLYSIQYAILYLIDFVVDVFRVLAGLNDIAIPIEYNSEGEVIATKSDNLLTYLLSSTTIVRAFLLVVSICFALVIILTIIAIIRKQYLEEREQRSLGAIVGTAMKSCLMFILVPVIMIAASSLLVVLVQQIDLATNPYYEELYNSGATSNDSGYSGLSIGGTLLYIIGYDCTKGSGQAGFISGTLSYDLNTVKGYYDISDINYFLGYVAGIVILVLFIKSLFTFVERTFAIVGLFLVAPLACSSSVLDGGSRFKAWRDEVINKFIIAYSVLIAVNLYFLIIPLIMDVNFGMGDFGNFLIRLFFIIGGAFAVNKSTTWFGNIVNSGAGSQAQADSDNAGRSMWGAARGAARATAGAVRATANAAGKGYNFVKGAAGFVTPLDRLQNRGKNLRDAKLKSRDKGAAEKWQENFNKKNGIGPSDKEKMQRDIAGIAQKLGVDRSAYDGSKKPGMDGKGKDAEALRVRVGGGGNGTPQPSSNSTGMQGADDQNNNGSGQ